MKRRRWRTTTTTICSLYNASFFFFFWPVVRRIKLPTQEICQDKRFETSCSCASCYLVWLKLENQILSELVSSCRRCPNVFMQKSISFARRWMSSGRSLTLTRVCLFSLSLRSLSLSPSSSFTNGETLSLSLSVCSHTRERPKERMNERGWRVYRAANWKINEANIFKQPPHCYSHCWTNEIEKRHQQ